MGIVQQLLVEYRGLPDHVETIVEGLGFLVATVVCALILDKWDKSRNLRRKPMK
jgi:hypothetical protein